ncbi:MAG: sulfotransferase, partial [Candidatus Omnitrophica bacterium]|nr:sulfotransferase [Candidatus Omnitrophota bacterium]
MSSSPATNKIAINCTDPIIIGGYPGSGTTMLILTLNQHKNIVGHKETQLIRVLRILDDYLFCQKNDTFPRYLKRYFSQEEIKRSIGVFIDDLLGKKVVVEGKRRWAEKSPHNCNFLTLWKACIPKAKFINVIRDGRDVVCSGMSYGYFKFEDGIKAWIKTIEESKKESMSLGGKNYC